jgi:TRAP-type mannitol/chloroaromatic compound transport system substrate-binding protein
MDRREFLISTSGVAAAAASATATAAAEPATEVAHPHVHATRTLRLAMPWADNGQGPGDSARRVALRLGSLLGGQVEVAVSASGVQADADLLHGSAHDFAGLHPAFAYFAGLPGNTGLSAQDFSHWLIVGGGQMLWDDLARTHDFKPLLAGHSGEAPPLWSREPVTGLLDFAGRQIYAPGLGADAARGLGAEPQQAAVQTLAETLRGGSLDLAEAGGLLTSLATGMGRATRHATGQGLNGYGTAYALTFRLPTWERFSPAEQAMISAAAAEEFQVSLAEARAHERIARRTLESGFGVRFAPWPSDVADALDRVAEATVAHLAGRDAIAARIDHSYMAFRAALSGLGQPPRGAASAAIS